MDSRTETTGGRVWRILVRILDIAVAAQFFFFAWETQRFWVGAVERLDISPVWIFLAFAGAGVRQLENAFPQLRRGPL